MVTRDVQKQPTTQIFVREVMNLDKRGVCTNDHPTRTNRGERMKTIKVSDEIYDFLISTSKEINSQDNRITAEPYFYQIREEKEIATGEGMGEEVWVMDGEIHLRTEQDIKEAVFEWKEWDLENKLHQKKYSELGGWEIDEILEENYRKVHVSVDYTYSNCFLTEKAARQHIKINGHNLKSPVDYLIHAYRNHEMINIFKFLKGLTEPIKDTEGKDG